MQYFLPAALLLLSILHCSVTPRQFMGCPTQDDRLSARRKLMDRDTAVVEKTQHNKEIKFVEEEKEKTLGGLETGSLKKIGGDDYLNRMYTGIKNDFESSGMEFEQMSSGLKGRGISLEKITNQKGLTTEILIQIDGDLSFASGSYQLTPAAKSLVTNISEAMDAYPETQAKVWGHTDSPGAKEYNYVLSNNRANALKNHLLDSAGLAAYRIYEVKGFADDMKIVQTNASEARNRRVEIRILPLYVKSDRFVQIAEKKKIQVRITKNIVPAGTLAKEGPDAYFQEAMKYTGKVMPKYAIAVEKKNDGSLVSPEIQAVLNRDASGKASSMSFIIEENSAYDIKTNNFKDRGIELLEFILEIAVTHPDTNIKIDVHSNSLAQFSSNSSLTIEISRNVKNQMMLKVPNINERIASFTGFSNLQIEKRTGRSRIEVHLIPSGAAGK